MLVKNTQSSRAVPTKKLLDKTILPDWLPQQIGFNSRGMSPKIFMTGKQIEWFQLRWDSLHSLIEGEVKHIQKESKEKWGKIVEKGIINRPLENFKMTRIVISGLLDMKGWGNFIHLRDHNDAQSDITILAQLISELISSNEPRVNDLHLPMATYDGDIDDSEHFKHLCKESICNLAATSYRTESLSDSAMDRIIKKLVENPPRHWSPFEHPAINKEILKSYFAINGLHQKAIRHSFQWVRLQAHYYGSDWIPLRKLYSNDVLTNCINSNTHEGKLLNYDSLFQFIERGV